MDVKGRIHSLSGANQFRTHFTGDSHRQVWWKKVWQSTQKTGLLTNASRHLCGSCTTTSNSVYKAKSGGVSKWCSGDAVKKTRKDRFSDSIINDVKCSFAIHIHWAKIIISLQFWVCKTCVFWVMLDSTGGWLSNKFPDINTRIQGESRKSFRVRLGNIPQPPPPPWNLPVVIKRLKWGKMLIPRSWGSLAEDVGGTSENKKLVSLQSDEAGSVEGI